MAMGRNPNRTTSEHTNPTTKIGAKMDGARTPKWDTIGADPRPYLFKVQEAELAPSLRYMTCQTYLDKSR